MNDILDTKKESLFLTQADFPDFVNEKNCHPQAPHVPHVPHVQQSVSHSHKLVAGLHPRALTTIWTIYCNRVAEA